MTELPKLLLSTAEAAESLGISERTLYALTEPRGTIPAVSIGPRGKRYSVEALRRWIAEQESTAGGTT